MNEVVFVGTSDAFVAAITSTREGGGSFGQSRRCAWMRIVAIRHAAVTAAGMNPPRKMPTTDVWR